jgi:hypothetical protein
LGGIALRFARQNCVTEWSYSSGRTYADPFNDITLDVLFTDPDGQELRVPAFWAGEQTWRVRYASPTVGTHRYRTICSDESNPDLHGLEGTLEVAPYEGSNPLLEHGPIRLADSGRHFAHADGAPFLWLGDTWWMGLCKRLGWPGDFQMLAADRVAKGFSVIQIVAGLYPDMSAFDERGANEAGFPWKRDYSGINPAYFDMADLRIDWLVSRGLVPCIVGCWGYFLGWMGVQRMKQHWRNLIARYGAYPVVWCLAGEFLMPYYLSEDWQGDVERQKQGWAELSGYVRQTDPYRRPITLHPQGSAREQMGDASLMDFDMLQTGHSDRASIPNTVQCVTRSYNSEPTMPVINGEVCYEGILEASREEVQRFMFWCCMLSGAAGHTYGANGIWQVNEDARPFGPSPHGSSWGDRPWREAYQLPGSGQLGLAKRLLERYEWWRFEPHPEWVEPHWTEDDYLQPYAAGIPGEVRIIFMPSGAAGPTVTGLESGVAYQAFYWNPSDASQVALGTAQGDAQGRWQAPKPPIFRDWVLVIERR